MNYFNSAYGALTASITLTQTLTNAVVTMGVATESTQIEFHPSLPSYDNILYDSGTIASGRARYREYVFDKLYPGTISIRGYASGGNNRSCCFVTGCVE